MSCACRHWDAFECARARDRGAPAFGNEYEEARHPLRHDADDRCDCCCHDRDQDEGDGDV